MHKTNSIKNLILIAIVLFPRLASAQEEIDAFFINLDNFYHTYITNGLVDYKSIIENPLELNNLASTIQYTSLDSIESKNKKAYLINAYNLLVIKQVTDNFPIQSPQEIGSFFDGTLFYLGKRQYTLNQIENNLLRTNYKDNRLHFVLVCGALGCPPINSNSYQPAFLEQQLKTQTTLSINDTSFIYTKNGTTYLSEIFQWYREDFGKNDAEIIQFINSYRKEKIKETDKLLYYTYNWNLNDVAPLVQQDKLNLQTYTAGSLLGKGKIDITLFNTLYTQTKSNWKGVNYSGFRESFHTSLLQLTYGSSKNKRLNIGIDINIKSSSKSVDSTVSSIGNTYKLKNNDSTRFGIASLGPRIKIAPFKKIKSFSIQSTLLLPTIKHPEGFSDPNQKENLYWSDWNRYIFWNQFYIDKTYRKVQLFFETDLLFRFRRSKSQITHLDTPLNLFISYFPTKKTTLYVMGQHVTRFTNDSRGIVKNGQDWVIPMNYSAYGIGAKYQIIENMNIEVLYTNFWRGTNSGIGNTLNIGLKYITK